jgi:carbonic anhydrase
VPGCSDSRTPIEILFDQGLGDLFVVRIAGNVVAPSAVGSIELAASQFGTGLVVVLGHTQCGAIAATLKTIQTGKAPILATFARPPTGSRPTLPLPQRSPE